MGFGTLHSSVDLMNTMSVISSFVSLPASFTFSNLFRVMLHVPGLHDIVSVDNEPFSIAAETGVDIGE
jgi:hypothetical protein